MSHLSKLLLAAALLVMAAGIGLAVAQPGSLGGNGDESAAPTTGTSTTETSTTVADSSTTATSTTAAPTTTSTTAGSSATTSAVPPEASTTTGPGSGLGASGAAQGSDTSDGLAKTGGESMLLAGLVLGGLGLATHRRPSAG